MRLPLQLLEIVRIRTVSVAMAAFFAVIAFASAGASAAQPCESLVTVALPSAAVQSAVVVPASSTLPAHCQIDGVAAPTSDSVIKFQVRLPLAGWNGKFNGIGNGGYGGTLPVSGIAGPSLARGYATAGTDMGHDAAVTPGGTWAFGHPEKIADWAYRANHVTAGLAKTLIRAFYGVPPRLSYFIGCSDGGHEGLMEAQRFPDDYDGIVAGASANYWTHQSAAWVWEEERSALDDVTSVVPPSKLAMISQAAVAACDDIDGLHDGQITDPTRCRFDPAVLQCAGADAPTCLTAAQVQAIREIYTGPRNPRTRESIYPGLERGGEYNWPGDRGSLGRDFYKYFVFNNPSWDFHTLDFDHDVASGDTAMAAIINSTSPDLRDFKALGGKLIMYHGWYDARVNPRNSIDYYRSVIALLHHQHERDFNDKAPGPAKETDAFLRLFMAPAMTHCSGGTGPNAFGGLGHPAVPDDASHNVLIAVERWVEQGIAPARIIATKYVNDSPAQGVQRTRPLCAYPQLAQYTGHGSIDDAASFVCVKPQQADGDDD